METLSTQRLRLVPLSLSNLRCSLTSLADLSVEVGLPISTSLLEGAANRAVRMKIEKMGLLPPEVHLWYTYWLIVIREENIGAGMVGFKGLPNAKGEVEIGYGIDPVFRQKGYMSEAVQAIAQWAFSHPECKAITASGVLVGNLGSQKVLEKCGFTQTDFQDGKIDYILRRVIS